MLYSPLAS